MTDVSTVPYWNALANAIGSNCSRTENVGALTGAEFECSTAIKTILNIRDVFEFQKQLGKGNFGSVWLIRNRNNNELYALKILQNANFMVIKGEVGALAQLSRNPNCNPNIVCYYDVIYIPEVTAAGQPGYGVLMQYITGLTLDDYLFRYGLSAPQILEIGKWLLLQIVYLHNLGYVHRDIKPANIMIATDGRLVLIDFGFSCLTQGRGIIQCSSFDAGAGTPGYLAPEIASGLFYSNVPLYYRTADVYAIGATLYYLLTHQLPKEDMMLPPENCLFTSINTMLTLDPHRRPNAQQSLQLLSTCLL